MDSNFYYMKTCLSIFLLLVFFSVNSYAQKVELASLDFLINVKGVSELSKQEVVQIFRNGRSLWSKSDKVLIVLPANNSVLASDVAANLYGSTVSGMQKFWLALVFQGRANPPVFLQTAEEILSFVKNNPGAIGVIPSGSLAIPANFKLKVR